MHDHPLRYGELIQVGLQESTPLTSAQTAAPKLSERDSKLCRGESFCPWMNLNHQQMQFSPQSIQGQAYFWLTLLSDLFVQQQSASASGIQTLQRDL